MGRFSVSVLLTFQSRLSSRTSLLPSPATRTPTPQALSRQFGVQPKSRDGIALEPAAQLAMVQTPEGLSSDARSATKCCGQIATTNDGSDSGSSSVILTSLYAITAVATVSLGDHVACVYART